MTNTKMKATMEISLITIIKYHMRNIQIKTTIRIQEIHNINSGKNIKNKNKCKLNKNSNNTSNNSNNRDNININNISKNKVNIKNKLHKTIKI